MKIVIAPDSFKGSLTAREVAEAMERGLRRVDKSIQSILVPMSDGGEGTVQSLVDAVGGKIIYLPVNGPLLDNTNAFYGILADGNTAVIEMAAASGLPLIEASRRNPLLTTTYGTGQLIKDALDKGCRNFIIGLGGSATNDGGCGMIRALGAHLFDAGRNEIGLGGGALGSLHTIDLSNFDSRIGESTFVAACDVTNLLCGENGASAIYGPQKGAKDADVILLDKNLAHLASVINHQLKKDIVNLPGAGAAGGLGAGVVAFLNGKLEKGIDIVIRTTGLEDKLEGADLVLTGEGLIDYQTAFGKTPFGVAQIARRKNIPVIAIAGGLGKDYNTLYDKGFDALFSIVDKPMSLDEAMRNGALLIEQTTENIFRTWISANNKIHNN